MSQIPQSTTSVESLTHAELINQAAKWLERQGCAVVITDMSHGQSETPDAIGWKGTRSTLVECKASRADFLADRNKPFRRMPDTGMGVARYMCVPRGLIRVDELPADWGLIEWDGKRMRVTHKHTQQHTDGRSEISLLLSALRRVGRAAQAGVSVKYYTMESKNRATLGITDADDATEAVL